LSHSEPATKSACNKITENHQTARMRSRSRPDIRHCQAWRRVSRNISSVCGAWEGCSFFVRMRVLQTATFVCDDTPIENPQ
jgi:hypothetical protein